MESGDGKITDTECKNTCCSSFRCPDREDEYFIRNYGKKTELISDSRMFIWRIKACLQPEGAAETNNKKMV